MGGQAPYTIIGTLQPGQSVARPQRGTGHTPAIGDPSWSKPYPILPCNGLQWGHDGEVIHFSSVVPSANASRFIYGIMTWLFYAAKGAAVFSIEKTINPDVSWLNIFTSDPADWNALDALHKRLMAAGSDIEQVVYDVCDEVRP